MKLKKPVLRKPSIRVTRKGLFRAGVATGAAALASLSLLQAQESNVVIRNKEGHQIGIIKQMPKTDPLFIPTNSVALYESLGGKYKGWSSVVGFVGDKKIKFPMEIAAKRAFINLQSQGLSEKEIRAGFERELNRQSRICDEAAKSAERHGITLLEALNIIERGYWTPRLSK